ncbi:hypothetical protein Slin15195_G088200 [Septoria linicola]|uniref:Uncharacterized protein n=1 Tax=Septoria linicola TaxID=215465 RepID=A0A9Q9EL69_9PEZI|nr:hypothetical protein Slin14017_G090810 [Septoria linicola]USW55501.1 hypothetical protein Slin15195_G088200 [Septoria linicola]
MEAHSPILQRRLGPDGKLERQLGFRGQRLFHRRRHLDEPLTSLFTAIESILELAVTTGDTLDLDAQSRIAKAFDVLGPSLWPDVAIDRSAWLVSAKENDWNGLYPQDLYYSKVADRKHLRHLFTVWISEKYWTRRQNHKAGRIKRKPSLEGVHPAKRRKANAADAISDVQRRRGSQSIQDLASSIGSPGAYLGTRGSLSRPISSLSNDSRSAYPFELRQTSSSRSSLAVNTPLSFVVVLKLPRHKLAMIVDNPETNYSSASSGTTDSARTRDSLSTTTTVTPPHRRDAITSRSVHMTASRSVNPSPDPEVKLERDAESKSDTNHPQGEGQDENERLAFFNAVFAPLSRSCASHSTPHTRPPAVGSSSHQRAESSLGASGGNTLEDSIVVARKPSAVNGMLTPVEERSATATAENFNTGVMDDGERLGAVAGSQDAYAASVNHNQRDASATVGGADQAQTSHNSERRSEQPDTTAPSPSPPFDILDRATLLSNWNPHADWNLELDVDDWATMEDCSSVEDFFVLIEAQMPKELARHGGHICQVKVKMMDGGVGPKLDCRMPRNDKGRGALRQMLKKLTAQCEVGEPELKVEVEWE